MSRKRAIGWALLCFAQFAWATKPPVRVTPVNLANQPHALRIEAEQRDAEVGFTITLQPKNATPVEDEAGLLLIVKGGRTIATVPMEARRIDDGVQFEFLVASEFVGESIMRIDSATATAAKRKQMTSAEGWIEYECALKDFVRNP